MGELDPVMEFSGGNHSIDGKGKPLEPFQKYK
jgi:hypothetical protein